MDFRQRIENVIKDVAAENNLPFTEVGLAELTELMQPKVHEIIWVLLGLDPEDVEVKIAITASPVERATHTWKTDINIKAGTPRPGCKGCRSCSKGSH